MLARRLTGPYVGDVVDMIFDDVRRAEANGSVKRLSADEAARFAAGPEEVTEDAAPAPITVPVVTQTPVPKRQVHVPRGRARRPDILART